MRLRALIPSSALLTLALGAPPSGTELEAGGETGAYHYIGGCGGPHNYDNYSAMQIRARHRASNGTVLVSEAAAMFAQVKESVSDGSTVGPQIGKHDDHLLLALRIGYEGRYGGFEVGPAAGYLPASGAEAEGLILPSARVWAGRYGAVHGWASLLADRTLSLNRIIGIGIGHRSDRVKASLGLAASAGEDGSAIADLDLAVWRNLWLGAGGQLGGTSHTWGATLRVGFFIDSVPDRVAPDDDDDDAVTPEPPPPPRAAPPAPSIEPEAPVVTPSTDAVIGDAGADPGPGDAL